MGRPARHTVHHCCPPPSARASAPSLGSSSVAPANIQGAGGRFRARGWQGGNFKLWYLSGRRLVDRPASLAASQDGCHPRVWLLARAGRWARWWPRGARRTAPASPSPLCSSASQRLRLEILRRGDPCCALSSYQGPTVFTRALAPNWQRRRLTVSPDSEADERERDAATPTKYRSRLTA